MKTTIAIALFALVCCGAYAQKNEGMKPKVMTDDSEALPPPPPQRIYPESVGVGIPTPATPSATSAPFVYEQRLWGSGVQPLFTQSEAQLVIDNFRSNFTKLGSPRILIYVNRSLVDDHSGLKLSSRTERVDTTRTWSGVPDATNVTPTVTAHTTANNTYNDNGSTAPSLTDRQTMRDVERLVGGPFRSAGASLVDQSVATQLMGTRPLDSLTTANDQARKDRESISKIADVAVEVLISSRSVTTTEVSGDHTYSVPDIQLTAIRLGDAKVLGQASAADVINKAGGAPVAARNFGVEAITDATALALMEDMTLAAK